MDRDGEPSGPADAVPNIESIPPRVPKLHTTLTMTPKRRALNESEAGERRCMMAPSRFGKVNDLLGRLGSIQPWPSLRGRSEHPMPRSVEFNVDPQKIHHS